mgnify:CR=1 FL=1
MLLKALATLTDLDWRAVIVGGGKWIDTAKLWRQRHAPATPHGKAATAASAEGHDAPAAGEEAAAMVAHWEEERGVECEVRDLSATRTDPSASEISRAAEPLPEYSVEPEYPIEPGV